jgi:cysteine synthase
VAARRLAEQLVKQGRQGVIVTIGCDGASKYLHEDFWQEAELAAKV